ncbi:MAG: RHS repeat protein [Synechococcaceae cyanobacterium SM2_3_2]|nr:RHS repeat protein [Synechococcaceae cyanobacterium SM2_3_2]
MGRLEEVVLPDETPEDLSDNPRTRTEYDKAGRIKGEIDERGNRREYDYDNGNRRIRMRDALNYETRYIHDAAGKVIEEIDPLGRSTRTRYVRIQVEGVGKREGI